MNAPAFERFIPSGRVLELSTLLLLQYFDDTLIVLVIFFAQSKRIRKRDRVVPGIGIQIHAAREPDGILGQKPAIYPLLYVSVPGFAKYR